MYNAVSGETVTYTYDSLNRLATASGCNVPSGCTLPQTELWGQAYVYDPFGNLRQKNITGGSAGQPSTQVTVNANNQINSVSGLSYDLNGNQNVGSYDAENRLTSASGLQYGYDGQNKRIWSWAGAVDPENNTTNFTVSVYTPSGQKLGAYLLAPAFVQNSQTEFAVVPSMQVTLSSSDIYFGSRRVAVMDQLGSVVKATAPVVSYFPWGETKGASNPQDTWNFATYWQDSNTGLDYANNRYYANAYGRFATPDPYQG